MIILLVIIAILGFTQSFLQLIKDDERRHSLKPVVQKGLSYLYIIGLIVSIIVLFIQDYDTTEINNVIKKTDTTVRKSTEILTESIDKTQKLLEKADSLDKKLKGVMVINDSLVFQYEKVNNLLSKQIEFDLLQLKEKAPFLVAHDGKMECTGNDSTSYSVCLLVENLGNRIATVVSTQGFVLFVDSGFTPISYLNFPESVNVVVPPRGNEVEGYTFCSNGLTMKFSELTKILPLAFIYFKVNYRDLFYEKIKSREFYAGWNSKDNNFGGLRAWQVKFLNDWAKANNKQ